MSRNSEQILIVDDDPDICWALEYLLHNQGFVTQKALNAQEALDLMEQYRFACVILDAKLPDIDGLKLARQILEIDPNIRITMVSGYFYISDVQIEAAISQRLIDDFISKPFLQEDILKAIGKNITERKQALQQLQQSREKMQETLNDTVQVLASAVETKDPYTAGHQQRVAELACAIAAVMGLTPDQIEGLRVMGCLHDIGKIAVPAEILCKPGKISEIEFNIIKLHPQAGHDIVKAIKFPWPVSQGILQHHERLNGSGYPQGLYDHNILLEAKILAVSDVVEAMTSFRPYRPALGIEKALEEITQNNGKLYDPEVVDTCLTIYQNSI
jgi:HD-GYP domain-containing protein (c-di-GMP phosphodiesterase class II)